MSWFQAVPTLLVAVLVIFAPGAVLGRSLGARGTVLLGMSAPLTVSLVAVTAVLAQFAGVHWGILPLAAATVGASLISLAVRYVVVVSRAQGPRPVWIRPAPAVVAGVVGGVGLGGAIITARMVRILGRPDAISQTYDAVFHLNAVRKILDTGNASSLYLGDLESGGGRNVYPGAWHALAAVVIQLTHISIPVGVNCVNIVIAAVVWTVSSMYLATRITGSRPAAFLLTGAMAGAFGAFPYLLVNFGVLYPNFLAIALLPAFIALTADLLRLSNARRPGLVLGIVLLLAGLPGLALAHPSVLLAWLALAMPMSAFWLVRQGVGCFTGRVSWLRFAIAAVGLAAYIVLVVQLWQRVRPSEKASFWPPTQTVAQALGEAVTNSPMRSPISWIVFLLILAGLYALRRHPWNLWLAGPWAMCVFLYVAVSAFAKDETRSFFTGVFYNDSFRLAAMLPVIGLPLCVIAGTWIFDAVLRRVPARWLEPRRLGLWAGAVGSVAAVVLAVAAQGTSVGAAQRNAMASYALTGTSTLLTVDEAALIARADRTIPAGATVIGNPATGASLVYALADRKVILPAVGSTPSADDNVLTKHLTELATDPQVCQVVRHLDAFYILDFGAQQINNMHVPFPTSEELAAMPGLTLVDHQGDARLYKINACG